MHVCLKIDFATNIYANINVGNYRNIYNNNNTVLMNKLKIIFYLNTYTVN